MQNARLTNVLLSFFGWTKPYETCTPLGWTKPCPVGRDEIPWKTKVFAEPQTWSWMRGPKLVPRAQEVLLILEVEG